MFTLVLQKSAFIRIRRGTSSKQVTAVFGIPVGEVYAGEILPVKKYRAYTADVGEGYKSIAKKFGLSPSELIKINGDTPVYPTRTIHLPE